MIHHNGALNKERVEMKKIGVFTMVFLVSMASFASEVETSLEQADKLESQGETEAAIRALKDADAASPDNPEVDKRLSRLYARRIQEITDQAEKKTDASLAVELGKKAVAKLPDDAQAHIGLAAAYGQLCWFVDDKTRVEYSKAIHQEVNKGLALDPDSDYGHLILARWNFEMATLNPVLKGIAELVYGQFPPASTQAAIVHFKKAIQLNPTRVIHHAEYAKALEAMGDKEQAREEWTKVIELKAVDAQDRFYQRVAAEHLHQKAPAESAKR
jgi:Flp pilus assembly protein TadD